jgi:pyruvate kinase
MPARRSKILITTGPASRVPETFAAMVAAGADGFRVNASHGSPDEWREDAQAVRKAAAQAGRPLALVFDLCGPKLRLAANAPERRFEEGDVVRFGDASDAIPVSSTNFAAGAVPGRSHLVVGDGTPRFTALSTEGNTVTTRCLRGGTISPSKGLYVTHSDPIEAALTSHSRSAQSRW